VRFFARRPADHRSRARRWHDTVAELLVLQTEYDAWLEALPDTLQDTATAGALRTISELDLSELQAIDPPRDIRPSAPAGRRARLHAEWGSRLHAD
jgi:hypothetical protein